LQSTLLKELEENGREEVGGVGVRNGQKKKEKGKKKNVRIHLPHHPGEGDQSDPANSN